MSKTPRASPLDASAAGFRVLEEPGAGNRVFAGRTSDAQRAVVRMLQIDPALRISNVGTHIWFRRPEDAAKWVDGLRKAGLPE